MSHSLAGGVTRSSAGGMMKHGTLLFAAAMVANASNSVFRVFMSHRLGPDYKTLDALLAVFMIISLPASAIQTVTAKYTSDLRAQGRGSEIADLFTRSMRWIGLSCACGLVLFCASARVIADFLQIDAVTPVVLLGLALFTALLFPPVTGLLQGFQRFLALGLLGIFGAAVRLVAGVGLILLGFGVNGAVGASVISTTGALGGALLVLRPYLRRDEKRGDSSGVYRYLRPVILFLVCQSVLCFVDSIVVKHSLAHDQADAYARAAIVGKAFLFLPTALAMVLFPKASERHTLRESSFGLLIQAVCYSLLLAVVGGAVCFGLAGPLAAIVGGARETADLIRYFGFAVTPVALLQLLINHDLAVHRASTLAPLAVGTVAYTAVLFVFHGSPEQILTGMGLAGLGLCALCLAWSWGVERRVAYG